MTIAAVLAMMGAFAPQASAQGPACTITWDGVNPGDWHFLDPGPTGSPNDDITNWTPNRIPNNTDVACVNSGTAVVQSNQAGVGSYHIGSNGTISVTGGPSGCCFLSARQNSTNAGTLSVVGVVDHADCDGGPDSEGLTNTGTVVFPSPGGGRVYGDLTNQGTLDVNGDAFIQRVDIGCEPATVDHVNQGTIDIATGSALRVLSSGPFTHGQGSVITGGGTMNFSSGRLEVSGNAQIAAATDVNLAGPATLAGTAGSTATGNFDFVSSSVGQIIEGTVPAGVTVDIDGTFVSTPTANVTNAGTININGGGAWLHKLHDDLANPTTSLINTGTIRMTNTGTGFRGIHGDLTNQGTIVVDHPEGSFQQVPAGGNPRSKLTNSGTITVQDAGDNLRICCGVRRTINANGGVLNGNGSIGIGDVNNALEIQAGSQIANSLDVNLSEGVGLNFNSAGTATGNVDVVSHFNPYPLTGNVPSGFSIDLAGGAGLRSTSSWTNAGTINFGSGGAFVAAEDGTDGTTETITNTGQMNLTGSGGISGFCGNLVNQGQITVSHTDSRINRCFENRNPKFTNAATGTLTVQAGGVFQSAAGAAQGYENAGTVAINGSGRLSPESYTQTGGTTTLGAAASSLDLQGTTNSVTVSGGTLRGLGTVSDNLANTGGTVAPGTSPGVLTIGGNFSQGAGGTLAIEVQGAAAGTGHDQLVVGGTATLGGTLSIATTGFEPAVGQTFEIVDAPAPPTAPTVSGNFATVDESGEGDYDVAINPEDVTLTALETGPSQECLDAQKKLEQAKKKLKKLKQQNASKAKIKRAKKKVKKSKQAVEAACG